MRFVCVEFTCRPCEKRGVTTVLGAWAVETHQAEFEADQVFAKGENRYVTLQELPDGSGRVRQRFVMTCPRCRHRVELRAEKVDEALRAVYVVGARATTHRISR
jgi:hypothetical protein